MIAYVNHSFLEEERAVVQVSDLALQRGYAAFDFLRTKNGQPLFLDDYIDRLFNSASLMYLRPQQTKKEIEEIIYGLIEKNKLTESGIRIIFTGGYSPDSYEPVVPNLIVLQQPLQMPTTEKFNAGLKVITHEYQRDIPAVKSTNYLMGIWLQKKVREKNANDVLYHSSGFVSEFPRANVFIVTKHKTIITPGHAILKGVTRMKVLELAKNKFEVEVRPLELDEVGAAAEVFLTSTTKRLLPVYQVDDKVIGGGIPGPITTLLNEAFLDMEDKIVEDSISYL